MSAQANKKSWHYHQHPLTRNNRVVFLLPTCICLGPVQTAVSLCQNARCIGQNARCPVPIFAVSTCAALFCSTLAVGGIPPTTCTFPHPPILIRSTKTQTCKLGCNVQLHVGACATSTSPHPPQLTIPLQRTSLAHFSSLFPLSLQQDSFPSFPPIEG